MSKSSGNNLVAEQQLSLGLPRPSVEVSSSFYAASSHLDNKNIQNRRALCHHLSKLSFDK